MIAPESAAGALIASARRDLEDVQALLARGDDCLVALAVLARAAKRADEATFALLEARAEEAARERVVYTHRGYDRTRAENGKEIR